MKVTVTSRFADRTSAERAARQICSLGCSESDILVNAARREDPRPRRISYPTVLGGTVGAICGGTVLALPTMGLDFGATAIFGAVLGGASGAFFGKLFDIGHPLETPFRRSQGEALLSLCADSDMVPRICALIVEHGGKAEEPLGGWLVPMRPGTPPVN